MSSLPSGFLTLPPPGDRTLAQVQRKLRLLVARRLLDGGRARTPLERNLARLRGPLESALRRAPDAVLDAIGSPDVMCPLLACESGALPRERALAAAGPALLAALAARRLDGALDEPIAWEAPLGELVDTRGGRRLRFDPPARALAATPGGLDVELASRRVVALDGERPDGAPPGHPPRAPADGIAVDRPFHPLAGGGGRLHLAEVDSNPLAMREDHPDKSGNALDLGGRAPAAWTSALDGALELVRVALPTWHAELPLALERVVPVGYLAERHESASYREAPGVAYLSLHPDALTLAEAIVHETQHGKLNALLWLDPVLDNGYSEWTASPVRPDLRPLMGVLLAVHAFVPVAALHARLVELDHPAARGERPARRRGEILGGNARGLAVLGERARPTAIGARLLQHLVELDAATRDLLPGSSPARDALPG